MPAITSTFRSGEPSLPDILKDIHTGKIQLPDFQRGWVWDDDHIRSLVASVSLAYPIGAIMLLETGGNGAQFQPRPVEGTSIEGGKKPDLLILDGQQRLTSLYLALYSVQPVPTRTSKGAEIERFYYFDIEKCFDESDDRMEAVVSVPTSKVLTSDFGRKIELDVTSSENEYQSGMIPLHALFDHRAFITWRQGYQNYHKDHADKLEFMNRFEAEIYLGMREYRVPSIELLQDTPREAVCQVFEKVNTGGVTLTVFELMTAIYAASSFNLRQDWDARVQRLESFKVLDGLEATTFLTAVTLLASYETSKTIKSAVSCKRKDVLKLPLDSYKAYADRIENGLVLASRFLAREKVFDSRSLPYSTQLIPLSAICAVLGDRFDQDAIRNRISQWFWSGVFGELYGGASETRFAMDLPDVVAWIDGGEQPRTIRDSSFAPTRLLSLQTRLSAAYKGLMAMLMKSGCDDFLSGDAMEINDYFELSIDIHHIFPKKYCEDRKIQRKFWNSVVNKTMLSARTNRIIGGNAPSEYLKKIEVDSSMSPERLDEIVVTHQINAEHLRDDAFQEFILDRASRLLDLIERATGKAITSRDSDEVVHEYGAPLRDIRLETKA